MKKILKNTTFVLLLFISLKGNAQGYRDSVIGLYEGYNYPWLYLLVEKVMTSTDSLIIHDSLWSTTPGPGCPISCYQHKVILKSDSTWFQSFNYNGHFKYKDTIHLFFAAPGPTLYYYDAKKISSLGTTNYSPKANDFVLYPNPATDYLTLLNPFPNQESQLLIYDMFGKLIYREEMYKLARVEVSAFVSGMYVAVIESRGKRISRKFIKE